MKLSARNQLVGTVKDIKEDQIMAEITVTIEGGQEFVSVNTANSARRLDLKHGKQVVVVIHSRYAGNDKLKG